MIKLISKFYQLSDKKIIEVEKIVREAFGLEKNGEPDDDSEEVRGGTA